MRVIYDAAWEELGGIGRYGRELRQVNPQWAISSPRLRGSNPLTPAALALREFSYSVHRSVDVFFSPGYLPPMIAVVPTLITIHDLMYFADGGSASSSREFYFRVLRKRYLQDRVGIATVSQFSAARIATWLGIEQESIFLTGNGVSEIFFSSERYNDGYALIVSSERQNKNLVGQLIACSHAKAFDRIVWVATAAPSPEVLGAIRSLRMPVSVEVAVSDARLAQLYRGATALSCFSFDEGFGLPAAEALASGCAVAHSARGGLKEVVGSAGVVGDPASLESMVYALELAARDRSILAARARAQARKFTWGSVSKRVNAAICAIAS